MNPERDAPDDKPWRKWRNFNVWHGRLPHWRADDVTYFVTFRHRRELDGAERMILFREIMRLDARRWTLLALTVLADRTEALAEAIEGIEIGDAAERAKNAAARRIMKRTGERFPPFFTESYDRIVRDEAERGAFLEAILTGGDEDSPDEWPTLYVADAA